MSDEKHKAFVEWAEKAGFPKYDLGRHSSGKYYLFHIDYMYKAYCARDTQIAELQTTIKQMIPSDTYRSALDEKDQYFRQCKVTENYNKALTNQLTDLKLWQKRIAGSITATRFMCNKERSNVHLENFCDLILGLFENITLPTRIQQCDPPCPPHLCCELSTVGMCTYKIEDNTRKKNNGYQ